MHWSRARLVDYNPIIGLFDDVRGLITDRCLFARCLMDDMVIIVYQIFGGDLFSVHGDLALNAAIVVDRRFVVLGAESLELFCIDRQEWLLEPSLFRIRLKKVFVRLDKSQALFEIIR